MGQYDNYSNEKNIAKAQKRLDKLTAKRDPDPYEVELARRELETAKLFERCQIFGTEGWTKSIYNPNASIMFSDDNEVMMFFDKLISYRDISSYAIVENIVKETHTKTKKTGAITRAVVGGAIAGGVGVVAGAITAGSKSSTIVHEIPDGFYLQIFLKDGSGYQCPVPSDGAISNKVPKMWLHLASKLQTIVEQNKE
ncbi:hypothetical protein [Flavonifractor plautii]|uniref:hypothetical protein n=1 Tax=Flavonifractor plautii TaxID=292800 RepID=UPI003219E3EA